MSPPRAAAFLALLASLCVTDPLAAGGPDAQGVRWEASLEAGLERSAQEGRPVLLCVNALENEGANNALATVHYRSAEWGAATRGFVCLVGNPEDHATDGGTCARYGSIPCATHRAALDLAMRLFGTDLISPQHAVLEPDGGVFWRKEFFSGDVTPTLLLGLFVQAAPRLAIQHAYVTREKELDGLARGAVANLPATAATWLASGDPLAAPGIAALAQTSPDGARGLALVRSLAHAPPEAAPVLLEAAATVLDAPDDAPDGTAAWVETLRRAAAVACAPALARAAVRTRDAALRDRVLEHLAASAPDLARETRLLSTGRGDATASAGDDVPLRTRRAEARAGLRKRAFPALDLAADALAPGDLRGALLEADAAEAREDAPGIAALFDGARQERVRLAAALALLRAGALGEAGKEGRAERIADAIVASLADAVEGPDVRAEAVARLGADPGYDPEAWRRELLRALGGGR